MTIISNLKKSNDRLITQFDKTELDPIIKENCYHSPEVSDDNNQVIVHDLPWRSDTVSKFIEIFNFINQAILILFYK